MAALRTGARVGVRAAHAGEGRAIAALWRELWDAHEAWGGYPGSHDARVYEQLAARLEKDARVRGGQPILGRHVHLVAELGGEIAGQVEGWFERHGSDASTPHTCEVRSLIVRESARHAGAGRALLEALADQARVLSRGSPVVLAAEVLEPNPAQSFYERLGYRPVSFTTRLATDKPPASRPSAPAAARVAEPKDALAVALLDATLAARRRAGGDVRFDRPRAIDATLLQAIAAHLARTAAADRDHLELVTVETAEVRGSASLVTALLDPPFLPAKRAVVGRFAVDPARDPAPLVESILALACRLASVRGAASLELTDLTPPETPLYRATIACGARPWSRVVTRQA